MRIASTCRRCCARPARVPTWCASCFAWRSRSKPPTGFLRDIVVEHSGEHAGHFDIKRGGLLPIVNIARYAALAAGATTTSTAERLRAARRPGMLDPRDAATLEEAFELFAELRLDIRSPSSRRGEPPTTRSTRRPSTRSHAATCATPSGRSPRCRSR